MRDSNSDSLLRPFWLALSGGRGIGVTAASEFEARALAEPVRTRFWPGERIVGVTTDVDVSTIEDEHVGVSMGSTQVRGVWYPRLNV